MKAFCSMKTFWFCIFIWFALMAVAEASPCSKALQQYGHKLPDFSCGEKEKNDVIQDRLVHLFKRKSAKRKAELAKKQQPNSPSDVSKEKVNTEASVEEKALPNFQMNELKVTW